MSLSALRSPLSHLPHPYLVLTFRILRCRVARRLCAAQSEVAAVVVFELVFFGRLELRKGLVLFCDTLDQLMRTPKVRAS